MHSIYLWICTEHNANYIVLTVQWEKAHCQFSACPKHCIDLMSIEWHCQLPATQYRTELGFYFWFRNSIGRPQSIREKCNTNRVRLTEIRQVCYSISGKDASAHNKLFVIIPNYFMLILRISRMILMPFLVNSIRQMMKIFQYTLYVYTDTWLQYGLHSNNNSN